MAVRRLDNATWGFATSCFVCEPTNGRGLAIDFSYDDETELVTAEFTLGPEYSGIPRYVHGGVVLAILDEAMGWATIAAAERFAVVHQTATTFDRPVRVGRPYRVTASVRSVTESAVTARAEVVEADGGGRRCAEAHARLVVMTAAEASGASARSSSDTPGTCEDEGMNEVEVDIGQLEKARAEGTPLVDVRELDEYVAGHVPGAIFLPMSEIAERSDEVPADGPVYVICHVGGRSLKVVNWLRTKGVDAYSVDGGTKAWADSGREIVTGD
jgi:rhodanese-related sulfurtransferase/acyl-coenzyme A thioesterase PaaI-like protein